MKCTSCGAGISGEQKFCTKCGKEIERGGNENVLQ